MILEDKLIVKNKLTKNNFINDTIRKVILLKKGQDSNIVLADFCLSEIVVDSEYDFISKLVFTTRNDTVFEFDLVSLPVILCANGEKQFDVECLPVLVNKLLDYALPTNDGDVVTSTIVTDKYNSLLANLNVGAIVSDYVSENDSLELVVNQSKINLSLFSQNKYLYEFLLLVQKFVLESSAEGVPVNHVPSEPSEPGEPEVVEHVIEYRVPPELANQNITFSDVCDTGATITIIKGTTFLHKGTTNYFILDDLHEEVDLTEYSDVPHFGNWYYVDTINNTRTPLFRCVFLEEDYSLDYFLMLEPSETDEFDVVFGEIPALSLEEPNQDLFTLFFFELKNAFNRTVENENIQVYNRVNNEIVPVGLFPRLPNPYPEINEINE